MRIRLALDHYGWLRMAMPSEAAPFLVSIFLRKGSLP